MLSLTWHTKRPIVSLTRDFDKPALEFSDEGGEEITIYLTDQQLRNLAQDLPTMAADLDRNPRGHFEAQL